MNTATDTTELDSVLTSLRTKVLSGGITLDQLRWYVGLPKEERDALMEEGDDTDDEPEVSTDILRLISSLPLTLASTDGTETIPNAASVFTGYIDPDFRNYGADEASVATPESPVAVYEMAQDATFAQMFSSLGVDKEKLCLTQSQIITFVKTHREHLRIDEYSTFFLFKSKGNFFVARVCFDPCGRLKVDVYKFERVIVWNAVVRRRVVVPHQ